MKKTIEDLNEKIWYRALKIIYVFLYIIALLVTVLLASDTWDFFYGGLGIAGVILFFEILKRAGYYLFLGKLFPNKTGGIKEVFSSSFEFIKTHKRRISKVLIVTLTLALLVFTVPLVWDKVQSVQFEKDTTNEQIEKTVTIEGKFTNDNGESSRTTVNNISISNPYDLKISENEMPIGEADPDISITVMPLSEYVKKCVAPERGEWATESAYREILEGLKNTGKHPDLPGYDSMGCGWTHGNTNSEYIKIDGLNAIIYNKALYQDIGSLSVFYKQVLFLDENNNVYDIVFNYSFGELEEYLNSIKDQYGSAYAYDNQPENWPAIEKVWQEVFDYFDKNKPILDQRTQGFQENDAIIKEMIKSIKIDRNKQPVLSSTPSTETQEEHGVEEAFISIPDINTLSRSENGAYYIYGTTSDNCESVKVTASNSVAGMEDSYFLKQYKKGDIAFKYGIREDWGNLALGSNTYSFLAYCDGGQVRGMSTTLEYTIKKPTNNYSDLPSVPTFWDGYAWAESVDATSFLECQNQFWTEYALNGCNQYVKNNYTTYNTFHGYDCTEDCSGHEAGYGWAEENDIDDTYDCDGNSDSFIEGCEAYVEENQ